MNAVNPGTAEIKSHGSANAKGVANAVAVTARMLEENVTERITADLARVGEANLRGRTAEVAGGAG